MPSQYIDQKVVDNLFGMDYVFNLADEQLDGRLGAFNPLPLIEPAATPSAFTAQEGQLLWTAVDGAAGYVIYKNGAYLANLTETTYTDPDATSSDRYTLRTVSATGCLGDEVSSTSTGISNVEVSDVEIHTTRYGIYWNVQADATLYSLSGKVVASRKGMSMEWGNVPKGVYILSLVTSDGERITRKVAKKV